MNASPCAIKILCCALWNQSIYLFKNLVVAFISADSSPLMAGVNIVSPEDATSMKDYWLHMVMFNYCHTKFPDVKYSMHAGELTLGLVQPEDLTSHINDAVYTAGANRIGHGVDMVMKANHTSCCATWQKTR
jgi:adenosine deaminase/adenosine deaminase CECR1